MESKHKVTHRTNLKGKTVGKLRIWEVVGQVRTGGSLSDLIRETRRSTTGREKILSLYYESKQAPEDPQW